MKTQELKKDEKVKINYYKLLRLFLIGSIVGVILEGIWSIIRRGAWETHVITIIEPLCIIYSIGMIIFYVLSFYIRKIY